MMYLEGGTVEKLQSFVDTGGWAIFIYLGYLEDRNHVFFLLATSVSTRAVGFLCMKTQKRTQSCQSCQILSTR